ncbi:MAG: TIGR01777 family oxidoreductase, partial [Longimicrobiales bacterium]|nr:TIGR01777 family oxidoreductase [Longimicrobiales bacterium]
DPPEGARGRVPRAVRASGGGEGPVTHRSRFTTELPVDRATAFAWHERPGAFERLAPPWERIQVVERVGGIRDGRVTLRVARGPLHFTWSLRHEGFVADERFVDVQEEGPFARWRHLHRFEDRPEGLAALHDEIEWAPPLGAAGDAIASSIIERDLDRSFRFRQTRLSHDLADHARWADRPRLRVAISGSSGMIGSALSHLLTTGGHTVIPLVRSEARAREGEGILFDIEAERIDADALRGVDAVVHLAGEPIQALRWTDEKKRAIRESRVRGTALLSRALAELRDGPGTLVCASAVGFHGDGGERILDEEAPRGRGFLAETVEAWEGATRRAEGAGLRVVKVRLGVVLSASGGALAGMLPIFRAGAAGRLGSGRQYMPWIDLDDATGIFHHALMDANVHGVLLGAAPHPVPNATFTDTLGRIVKRPTWIPVPSLALRAGLGEMGRELLLAGQRVRPRRTLAAGYGFRFEHLEDSLRHQLGALPAGTEAGLPRPPGRGP